MKSIYKSLFFSLVSILLLSGCMMGPKVDKLEMTETKYVYRSVPEELYTYTVPEEPMKLNEYIQLSPPEKETYLINYSARLLSLIQVYQINFDQIRNLQKSPETKP